MTTRQTRRTRFNGKEFLAGGGLNLTDNPILVQPFEMVDAVNILIGQTPARKKRGGQTYYNTDGSDETASYPTNPKNGGAGNDPIIGLYEFWRYDGVTGAPKMSLMVRQGTKIWAIDARTGAATDLTGALVLPAGGSVTFQAFEGRVYWVGTGLPGTPEGYNYWDGVAATATAVGGAGQPPDGTPTYILSHGGRMWAWGVPGFPYRGYFSEFFDAENWATTAFGSTTMTAADPGSLDFDPFGDPAGINGGISFQDRLYFMMRRATFEVTGSTINDFFVRTVSKKLGCIGHKTIVPVGNDVFYATERGVVTLSSTDKAIEAEFDNLTRPVARLWNKGLDKQRYDQFTAVYDEEEDLYVLSAPSLGSSANDVALVLNVKSKMWVSTWTGLKARSLVSVFLGGRNRIVAGREDGVIALCGEESLMDLGETYTAKFKTGFLYPGEEIDIENVWKMVTLIASAAGQSSLTVNAYVDSKLVATQTVNLSPGQDLLGSTFILGQSSLGSGAFIPETFGLKGQGYGLQLEVIFNTVNDTEVYGFIVESMPAGSRIGGSA